MTTVTLSYNIATRKNAKNNITSEILSYVKFKWVYVIGILFFTVMLLMYLVLVNQLAGGSYMIKNYDKQIEILTIENQKLQQSFAESEFLGEVAQKAKSLDFEKTGKIIYVKIIEPSFADASLATP